MEARRQKRSKGLDDEAQYSSYRGCGTGLRSVWGCVLKAASLGHIHELDIESKGRRIRNDTKALSVSSWVGGCDMY